MLSALAACGGVNSVPASNPSNAGVSSGRVVPMAPYFHAKPKQLIFRYYGRTRKLTVIGDPGEPGVALTCGDYACGQEATHGQLYISGAYPVYNRRGTRWIGEYWNVSVTPGFYSCTLKAVGGTGSNPKYIYVPVVLK